MCCDQPGACADHAAGGLAMTATELRQLLAQMGVNQCEAARLIGIDPRTIRRYVAGATIPTTIEYSLRYLCEQSGQKNNPQ